MERMMRKLALIAAMLMLCGSAEAKVIPCPQVMTLGGGSGGGYTLAGAVGAAATLVVPELLVVAIATNQDFPLCGFLGLTCYDGIKAPGHSGLQ
jgi:hypothetical protein